MCFYLLPFFPVLSLFLRRFLFTQGCNRNQIWFHAKLVHERAVALSSQPALRTEVELCHDLVLRMSMVGGPMDEQLRRAAGLGSGRQSESSPKTMRETAIQFKPNRMGEGPSIDELLRSRKTDTGKYVYPLVDAFFETRQGELEPHQTEILEEPDDSLHPYLVWLTGVLQEEIHTVHNPPLAS